MEGTRGLNTDLDSALAEARAEFAARNPRSAARQKEAAEVMPGGNTRTVIYYPPFPLAVVKGEGQRLWDADGHEYRDFLGEYTAGLYGHSHPAIMKAIRGALDLGIALGGPNLVEARLAKLVCDRFPSIDRVRFTNSGTEGNLLAVSAARAFTNRSKILVMEGGYHGGVFYFSGPTPLNAPFPFVFGRYNDIEATTKVIREHAADLAAVIVEPMMGGGGCIPADDAFLAALRSEATKAGALLIFDEVMTSRLSPGGIQQLSGITPDLTSLGKYIGGGLTFGAFGGRADIMDHFDPARPDAWPHAGTFNNNILTMSAGVAGLTEVYPPEVAVALNARGDALRERLNAVCRAKGLPAQFTGRGSMMNIHFGWEPVRGPEGAKRTPQALRDLFHMDLLARGIYLARRGMINLSVPMTDGDFDALVAAVDEVLTVRGPVILATMGPAKAAA
ncbi:MAG: aspartate aminotransferase family protein [Alphaproteobacteria bacterium]|nr:aspartate aminotransferase family protein [Alphaproteobacteria bacterium]